jgi:Ni/Fe-hydrogenase 1 B-type cytochrome subunit
VEEKVLIQPIISRLFHWMFALCVILLLLTGFYIHGPVNLGQIFNMGKSIMLHSMIALVAIGLFLSRVYYYLITRSYRDIWFKFKDIDGLKGLIKYFLFIKKKPPLYEKYNSGQKLVYTSWLFAFIFMMISGSILYAVNFGNIVPFMITPQKARFYHFIGALYFLGTVFLHIYLVMTEDLAKLQAMLTGWVRVK